MIQTSDEKIYEASYIVGSYHQKLTLKYVFVIFKRQLTNIVLIFRTLMRFFTRGVPRSETLLPSSKIPDLDGTASVKTDSIHSRASGLKVLCLTFTYSLNSSTEED